MKRWIVACVVLGLGAGAGDVEARRPKAKKPAKASPSPAPSAAPSAAASAAPSADVAAHVQAGLEAAQKARKARFPEGVPAPTGQELYAWDSALVDVAAKELGAALAADPTQAQAAAALVDVLAQTLRADAFVAAVKANLKAFDAADAAQALDRSLDVLVARGQGDAAVAAAEAWVAKAGKDPHARRAAARIMLTAGGLDKARATAKKFRDDKNEPVFALWLGEAEILAGQPAKARAPLDAVAAKERRAAWLAALAAAAAGDKKANAQLKAVAGSAKPGEEGLAELGWLLDGANQKPPTTTGQQLEDLAKKATAEKKPVEAALALAARRRLPGAGDAATLLEAEVFKLVRDWNREAALIAPLAARAKKDEKIGGASAGDLHFRHGRALYHAGKFEAAEAAWKRSSEAGKDDAELHFHKARIYERLPDKKAEMIAELKLAAAWKGQGPHVERARQALAKIEAGKTDKPVSSATSH